MWPEIWYANQQIENPHLIYPGDRITLVYIDGVPKLVVERAEGIVRELTGALAGLALQAQPVQSQQPPEGHKSLGEQLPLEEQQLLSVLGYEPVALDSLAVEGQFSAAE